MKYQRRPEIVEAEQFDPAKKPWPLLVCYEPEWRDQDGSMMGGYYYVSGRGQIYPGDYYVHGKGPYGGPEAMNRKDFEKLYEPVPEHQEK